MKEKFKVYEPTIGDLNCNLNLGKEINWKKSLVVRTPNWLGDVLMALPALYQLRQIMPESVTLDVICPKKLESLWQCVPWVDNIIAFSGKRVDRTLKKALIEPLESGAALILPNSFGSAADLFMPSIAVRVGRRGHFRAGMLTHRLPQFVRLKGGDTHHQVSEYFDLVSAFGQIERSVKYPPLCVDSLLSSSLAFELRMILDSEESGRPVLTMAPGAAFGPAKQWPVSYYAEVAQRWVADGGVVVVVGTGAERVLGNIICEGTHHAYNMCGQTDLKELISILQITDVCLCNDSGTMHLAAACGTKGVAIFGSTSPVATGPLGGRWLIASKYYECSPCLQRECMLDLENRYRCLLQVKPEEVYEAIFDLMIYSVVD
ncbi:MAG: lipopolysaccharide heptosyltransferase II [Lentisphaeria bacterium]